MNTLSLSAFIRFVELVRSEVDGEIPVKQVKMLLQVLDCEEVIPLQDVARDLGTSSASATRNMQNLRKLGFIDSHIDPLDNRNRLLTTTDKGKLLKLKILELIQKENTTHEHKKKEKSLAS